jgi:PAS domain S-box-containing protein
VDKLVTARRLPAAKSACYARTKTPLVLDQRHAALEDGLIYAVGVDITERKRVEEATGRLASIVECSTDAILGLNLEGTVTSWNPAAEKLLGYPAAEMLGQEVRALTPSGRERELRAHLRRVMSGEPVQVWETERLRNDGVPIPVSISLSLLRDAAGAPLQYRANLRARRSGAGDRT